MYVLDLAAPLTKQVIGRICPKTGKKPAFLETMDYDPEYLCLDCGRKDTVEEFGSDIVCPACLSTDVLNYRLWKEHNADTPPPRLATQLTPPE